MPHAKGIVMLLSPRDEGMLVELSRMMMDMSKASMTGGCVSEVQLACESTMTLAAVIRMCVNTGDKSQLLRLHSTLQNFVDRETAYCLPTPDNQLPSSLNTHKRKKTYRGVPVMSPEQRKEHKRKQSLDYYYRVTKPIQDEAKRQKQQAKLDKLKGVA